MTRTHRNTEAARPARPRAPALLTLATAATLGAGVATPAAATTWLKLQGTEPPAAADRAKLWGFVQPTYLHTEGTELPAGPFQGNEAQFNQIPPDLDSSSTFTLRRARIGVRGANMPISPEVNYFFLAEFGNNGITVPDGDGASITDASVTLNHLPGARLRIGQFKYPGSEEGQQAIHVFDYINFTSVSHQILLERFFDADTGNGGVNAPNGSVGAYRDTGIQLFDWFRTGDWEHSYAWMIGNGNGIARADDNESKNHYLYWSSELVLGGAGPRREGWKLYAWHQQGERDLTVVGEGEQTFDRERSGFGSTFRQGPWRAAAEYITADGMIFNGTSGGAVRGSQNGSGTTASFNMVPEGEATGWYVDGGYRLIPALELDLRYDVLNRLSDDRTGERQFSTLTAGAQYFLNRKTRLTVNYEFREAEAPGLGGNHPANRILDDMDDRIGVQITAIF